MKWCLTLLVIREMEINITNEITQTIPSAGKDMGQLELS